MIRSPYLLISLLLAIEVVILYVSSHRSCKKYFSFLPAVFWIYFLPMLCSISGWIDAKASIYQTISNWFLPASLVLLLLSSDIKAILKLGKPALIMMLAGSVGIMMGMPLVFWLVKPWVGSAMWSGFGALSGSWIGGSANMIAVKEAIGTPDAIFTPMVVVDTVVPYVWLGFLLIASGFQWQFDRINRSERTILDDLSVRAAGFLQLEPTKISLKILAGICLLALIGAIFARWIGMSLPVVKNVLSSYAWVIIIASTIGIGLSFTSARRLEQNGASKIGYFFLYFVLTTIGAKAGRVDASAVLILIGAGFLVVLFHAGAIVLAARIIRAPMFLAAVASQANIGGVASAPIVAEMYQPGLACVGLLLAIFGNIMGMYLGIITAQLCRMVAG
jgi:uncharacterized membrane protein